LLGGRRQVTKWRIEATMNYRLWVLLSAGACLVVAGCGKGDKTPTGQVVATIDGKEITALQLRNEMGAFRAPDAKTRNLAERQALDAIISRKLLAQAAEEQKIDRTPEFAQQKQRLNETLLVRAWQDKIVKSVPPPSRDEADKFIREHPSIYSERKVLTVSQVIFPRINDPKFLEELKPLKTMPEIISTLRRRGLPYRAGSDQLDVLRVDPSVADQILALPPDELFVLPSGNMLAVNQITESRVVPLSNDLAVKHATQYLLSRRVQEAVQREFGSAVAKRRKDVELAKAYQPPKAPPGKAPARKTPAQSPTKAPAAKS
jgi:EpsD family peptidyl-prolyl cis-trans isomerase